MSYEAVERTASHHCRLMSVRHSRPARRRRMGQSLSNMRPAQPYTTFLVFSETTYQCSAEDTQLCSELHGGSAEEATLSLKLHGGPAEENDSTVVG
ncbi:uncharacterized protein LOC142775313 isoform X2 [Rhipicephalus microplus]|uniref:uncharacterized protein LOC142775313 isoform X2 n=1 Tax=Rhipicephalus microplus TaxID=6941 RepID=UPI003F6B31B1